MVCEGIEALCTVSKDGFASAGGSPLVLRPWQRQLVGHLFARRADGLRKHRVALIGMPRKNGKSALGSALALDGLLFDGRGAEVYSAAAEKEQARIVFGETKRMIAANEELAAMCKPMRDVVEVSATNSIYRVLSAEAYSKEGLNISRAIVDELHAHQTDELWNVLRNGTGARLEPLICAITTAGVMSDMSGGDSVCYRTFRYAVEVANGLRDDPSFFFAWWGAPQGADHLDPEVWRLANPGYGDILNPEDLLILSKQTPENDFRTKRLNQWVAAQSVWLPSGAWEALENPDAKIPAGADCVLALDGSHNGDCTALVLVSRGEKPIVELVALWEPGENHDPVDILDVEEKIRETCRNYHVIEIAADAFRWARSLQILADEGLPVVEFPQNPSRMTPATARFYEAVTNAHLEHNGDARLARHVANCTLKVDSRGARLAKDYKNSTRKIDAAVTAVMAFDRAASAEAAPELWALWD